MLRILRHPVLWLSVLALAVFVHLRAVGLLNPSDSPDTVSYVLAARADGPAELLSSVRTWGYPLFLRAVAVFAEDHAAIPEIHGILYFGAVLLLWYAVRIYARHRWLAFAAAAPLVYPCWLRLIPYVQPDFLGVTLALTTLSLLLLIAVRPAGSWLWAGLTVATFLTYQVRPAYLFLIALVPLLGLVLRLLCSPRRPARLGVWTAGLAVATLLPFLVHCGVRKAAVGRFGLVSFSGYNLIGVTASFLDRELVSDLPPEQQELAERILRERRRRKWRALKLGSWSRRWYPQYSRNVWLIAEPAARRLVIAELGVAEPPAQVYLGREVPPLSGELAMAINDRLSELSRSLIWRRPWLYLQWVRHGLWEGFNLLFDCIWMRLLPLLVIAVVPAALLRARPPTLDLGRPVAALALMALSIFALKTTLVTLISVPDDRYVSVALLLLPSALAAGLVALLCRTFGAEDGGRRG